MMTRGGQVQGPWAKEPASQSGFHWKSIYGQTTKVNICSDHCSNSFFCTWRDTRETPWKCEQKWTSSSWHQLLSCIAAVLYSWGTGTRMVVVGSIVLTISWLWDGPSPHFHYEVPFHWALGALGKSTSNMVSQWLYQPLKGLTRAPLVTVDNFPKIPSEKVQFSALLNLQK